MNPIFLKVPVQAARSFSVRQETEPNINSWWHYHPEIELIHIRQGEGTLFVGDTMHHFNAGDVVLLGSNLPHYWRYELTQNEQQGIYSTVIHFIDNFWGKNFGELSEMINIRMLIEKSSRGIRLQGESAQHISELIDKIYNTKGLVRIASLLEALDNFSECHNFQILSSITHSHSPSVVVDGRIRNVLEFTLEHLHEKISLKSAASIVGMTENSFCRFFKSSVGKTYVEFLTEARIAEACKLLKDSGMSVKEVCYSSGFDNFSSFFSKFKLITGRTPLQYKREIS